MAVEERAEGAGVTFRIHTTRSQDLVVGHRHAWLRRGDCYRCEVCGREHSAFEVS